MSLLPSRPDLSRRDEPEPRLVRIGDGAADAVFEALASETARRIYAELHDEPATASQLADTAETSIQNCRYHLENLEEADIVEIAGSQYSSKGREMSIYAPTDEPFVLLAGSDDAQVTLRTLLERFVGAVAGLAAVSLVVHAVVEGGLAYVDLTGSAGGPGPPSLPLATVVFIGGLAVLVGGFVWWYRTDASVSVIGWVWDYPALTGVELATSRRAVVAATGGAVVLAAVWLATAWADFTLRAVGPIGPAQWLVVGLLLAPGLQAYVNDGLLISWAVVFLPVFALGLASIGLGLAAEGPVAIAGAIGYPVLLATLAAVSLGTAGFVGGVGLRAVAGWLTGSRQETTA